MSAAREVVAAWRTLDTHAQASLRRGWPTLATALDRLQGETLRGLLPTSEVQAISTRYRESPWNSPPGSV